MHGRCHVIDRVNVHFELSILLMFTRVLIRTVDRAKRVRSVP